MSDIGLKVFRQIEKIINIVRGDMADKYDLNAIRCAASKDILSELY